ncbi:AGAP007613-PA-like protein [Anopheles sinensis]|uniref:AGAP007613-PA-like protein n=1 Tax=Anopheles sinensis TaxID=74873 RepID=A0A084VWZ5_ANOSI|nr:AGAP007613-PA-like protein [Anopheles sinensis]
MPYCNDSLYADIMHTLCCGILLLCVVSGQQYKQQLSSPSSVTSSSSVDSVPAAANNVPFRSRPYSNQYGSSSSEEEEDDRPVATYTNRQQQQGNNLKKSFKKPSYSSEELEQEEEPDRLTVLLEKSQFQCTGRTTGYYADESLGCEVFHYCQENQKHSWICPEGFTFHQVHLICMPPSGDNICEQSSKYHFVNDYLYKPINMEEHMTKPNVTLRYSERYYPENFYVDERHYDDERVLRQHEERHQPQQPVKQTYHHQPQQQTVRKQPVYATTPSSYRLSSPQPTHSVYRSPEEINISLQQRRPAAQPGSYVQSTTPRYEDESEYDSYERK